MSIYLNTPAPGLLNLIMTATSTCHHNDATKLISAVSFYDLRDRCLSFKSIIDEESLVNVKSSLEPVSMEMHRGAVK